MKNEHQETNLVLPSSERAGKEIKIDNHTIELNGHGNYIKDDGLAREIDARYGKHGGVSPKDFVVVKTPVRTPGSHNYFFGSMPEMPWKKKKEEQEGGG